jgi:cell division protein FtsZ
MTLFEVDAAANFIREKANESVNIIFGSTSSEEMNNIIRVSVVATGISMEEDLVGRMATGASNGNVNKGNISLDAQYKTDGQKEMELLEIPAFLRRVKKKNK